MRKEERNDMVMLVSPSRPTTINVERGAGHVAGSVRCEKQQGAGNFGRGSQSAQHGSARQLRREFAIYAGGKCAGHQGVDADPLRTKLRGEMPGELQQGRFGGAVME